MENAMFGAGCFWSVEDCYLAEEYHQKYLMKRGKIVVIRGVSKAVCLR